MIRAATDADAGAIADIYNYYVTDTLVTFEEEPISASEIARRIHQVQSAGLPWLVAEENGVILGYAYATPWKPRSAYRFSVEGSMYVDFAHLGCGTGSLLFAELLSALRDRNVHALIAGVSLPNEASVALQEKFGLSKVAHFSQVGFKFGKWIDVGYWQRLL